MCQVLVIFFITKTIQWLPWFHRFFFISISQSNLKQVPLSQQKIEENFRVQGIQWLHWLNYRAPPLRDQGAGQLVRERENIPGKIGERKIYKNYQKIAPSCNTFVTLILPGYFVSPWITTPGTQRMTNAPSGRNDVRYENEAWLSKSISFI